MSKEYRRKYLVWFQLIIFLLIISVVGCSPEVTDIEEPDVSESTDSEEIGPQVGGTLRFATEQDISSVDPNVMGTFNHEVGRHIYEGLLALNEGLGVIPSLANNYTISDDGTVYTFELNEGVLFHNGKEMTSGDVVYSLNRLLESPRGSQYESIVNIEAVDNYTVKITIAEPSGPFLVSLASPYTAAIIPEGIEEEQGGELTFPIGTGPFMFVEWIPDRHVHLKRFPEYWGGLGESSGTGGEKIAYIEDLYFIPTSEVAARSLGLEAGDLDLAFIPSKETIRLGDLPQLVVASTGPTFDTWNYWFNMQRAPFNDINLRMAFVHSINREELLIAAVDGYGEIVNSPYPPFSDWFTTEHSAGPEYDMDLAKDYIAKSSYNGEKITITTMKGYPAMDRMGIYAESKLKELGVNVELEYLEWTALFDKFNSGDYDLMVYGYGALIDPDEWYYGRLHRNNITNGWDNPEYHSIIEEARRSSDFEQRRSLYAQAQEIIMEDMPTFFTFAESYTYVHNDRVKGFKPWNAAFTRLWNVWLEE
jgi:peptide/nickel transport system substrate-binding protein